MAKKTGSGKNLLIVESPAKAKTIEKILDNEFVVKSCYGHIRDLPKNDKAIDVKNNFQPEYIISEDKTEVVKELKKLAKSAQEVWLATDEDREGEAISWHLCEALGLDVKKTKRIVFHEITKTAIQEAVKHPRIVNMDLVNAQQARRILDRLVGFKLSPILWRKIPAAQSLSAGRVQSVAVKLIVEREREIGGFKAESSFKVVAQFEAKDKYNNLVVFKAELSKNKSSQELAEAFLKKCVGAVYTVNEVQVKPGKKSPSAPFTTSTLQQEASRKLGYSVARTMLVAQKLYEAGKISYMRTDSTNLSEQALQNISEEIRSQFGANYLQPRRFSTKTANAQEAHEAIRPTDMSDKEGSTDYDEQKLYNLIWKRTIASQMSEAVLEKTSARIGISTNPAEELSASGEVLVFDGFLKVYMESSDEENAEENNEGVLPPLKKGDQPRFLEMSATERYTRPAPRYTEAALVKKLEELGIGRPSTYAPTISTVQKRGYVEKKEKEGVKRMFAILRLKDDKIQKEEGSEITGYEKNKLFPTDIGIVVTDFLSKHFDTVMDYGFTAEIEKEFDEISNGSVKWQEMIRDFYDPFSKNVENTLEHAERATAERKLGTDPASGKPIIARMGRFGPMIQIGVQEGEEKPKYAKIRAGFNLETITLEEALQMFALPRSVGEYEGFEMKVADGRFGPYISHNGKFISLKKGMDPFTVTREECIELIEAKKNSIIREWKEQGISVLVGRWGPYVKSGRLNAKIPKDRKPEDLTVDDCLELLEAAKNAPKKPFRRFQKKS